MTFRRPDGLGRLLGSAVINQAVLSLSSLIVGLIMVRNTADVQYAYYILGWNAILLLTSLQGAFFAPPMVIRLSRMEQSDRSDVVGGLYRVQQRLMPILAAVAAAITLVLWSIHVLNGQTGAVALVVIVATLAVLNREYFRMVLLAYRRPQDVLKGDSVYVAVLIAGAAAATLTAAPAAVAIAALTIAAGIGAWLLSRSLRRHEPWNKHGAPGILSEIAPVGAWSCAGAAIHWTFTQGYSYLVAGTLGVSAVAAVSATRLLMMPINVLSIGLSSLMLPLAAGWLHKHGAAMVLRRLMVFAAALAAAALVYFCVLWLCRDWIFKVILKKHFLQQDLLIALWFGSFLLMMVRDQLMYLLVVLTRFRMLTSLTLLSAAVSLPASYWGMRSLGEAGAPLGVGIGELISLAGIVVLSMREARLVAPPGAAEKTIGIEIGAQPAIQGEVSLTLTCSARAQ